MLQALVIVSEAAILMWFAWLGHDIAKALQEKKP